MCDKNISENLFMLKYCHDKYKTQKMCNNAVYSCLLTLKFVPDKFVASEMIEKLDSAVFSDYYIVFGDLYYDFVTFLARHRS